MSEDNEYSNGGNGRFDGLDERFKKGGHPSHIDPELAERLKTAMGVILGYYKRTLDPALLDDEGKLLEDLPTKDLIHEFKAAKEFKDAVDLIDKEASRVYDYMRLAAIPNRFEAENIKNVTVAGIGRVQLAGDLYAGIAPGKQDAAFEWLRDNGRGDLVKETVNVTSLKAVLKAIIVKGEEELPEGVFKAEPFTRASIVKA